MTKKTYSDKLQSKVEVRVLRTFGYNFNISQMIGLLTLEENLSHDEAEARWNQATRAITKIARHDQVSV